MGVIYVPFGFQNPVVGDVKSVHGASPYGASTIAGDRAEPTEGELEVAEQQGKVGVGRFMLTVVLFHCCRDVSEGKECAVDWYAGYRGLLV